jgi:hypothetical protein
LRSEFTPDTSFVRRSRIGDGVRRQRFGARKLRPPLLAGGATTAFFASRAEPARPIVRLNAMDERAKKMRERAAEFARLAETSNDSVIHAELHRLAVLYIAQTDRIERGGDQPSDTGEAG